MKLTLCTGGKSIHVVFALCVCVFVHVCEIDSVTLCTGGNVSASCLLKRS